jgi:hypothetical protein
MQANLDGPSNMTKTPGPKTAAPLRRGLPRGRNARHLLRSGRLTGAARDFSFKESRVRGVGSLASLASLRPLACRPSSAAHQTLSILGRLRPPEPCEGGGLTPLTRLGPLAWAVPPHRVEASFHL